MKLYSEDGRDIWHELEPDEELQYELHQLRGRLEYHEKRVADYKSAVARKEAEIANQAKVRAATGTVVQDG